MSLSRVFLYSSALTIIASHAVAKYCVKLPTCEELGYIYSADKYPNNRSIKCPFDTKKILLLDYCQAYGLTSCDSTSGECDECIVEKADGTKSNSGYWHYTRCNAGYSYKSGECPPTEVDREQYPHEGSEGMDESIGEIECVQSAQNIYCGYKSCNEGWNLNSGNCIVHDCGSAYPYTSCNTNGMCTECKSGTNTRYSEITCNSGYAKVSNKCVEACITPGSCEIGDIYAYNGSAIGVVFYNDSAMTKIVALTDIDSNGSPNIARIYWANQSDYQWITEATNRTNGKDNTDKILSYISAHNKVAPAATATSLYAPDVCISGSTCSQGNWYLPAIGELNTLYINKDIINNSFSSAEGSAFNEGNYWSSTESSKDYLIECLVFINGHIYGDHRYETYLFVRPALELHK